VLAALVAPGSRVLDLGTGSGALGRHLQEARRCRVDGVTLSAAERDEALAAYDRLEVLDLEDPAWAERFADRQYDVVVCADVLEHLREPERVLRACRRLLRPDGWLLVSVPNVAYAGMIVSLMHGDWTYGREGLLDRTHLRFYTRRSFTRLLDAEGWRVERVEPIELTWYYTEFWTPFDRLPPAVALYLLAQPDASAYQLVFAARRAETPAGGGDATLAAPVPAPDPAVSVAVFASTLRVASTDPAHPLRRLPALGRVGTEPQTLAFRIPAGDPPPATLRWYAADRPGFLRLHAMRLLDRLGQPLWQWRADHDGDAPLRGAARQQVDVGTPAASHVPLLLAGDEPWLDVGVPAEALNPAHGPWRFEVDCGWPLSADYLALLPASALPPPAANPRPTIAPAGPAPALDPVVEIVLPVYGGFDAVRRCVASVLDANCRQPWHLTIVDDASPDPEVGRWLREFAAVHPEVAVLTNARNLGFVATVNLGMRLAGRRDVVLLNSDTEVAADWLDRLHRAAWSGARVGTVTPFSNNATICSFPAFCEDNTLPPGHTTATLDRVFAAAHSGQALEIPTAVGFCMYIRRDCLDDVGAFDAETFGAGYGEENDFCLRASARGWSHLHTLDVFVYHAGATSFSDRRHELQRAALAAIRRLHPGYEEVIRAFVQRDPARPYREVVAQRLADPDTIGTPR
jgi:GT2 family glycosyltransferase/2-polyprenyl-3-methyl-5-hydroxy-6-metoxy-1,4-benzoquinol methylase